MFKNLWGKILFFLFFFFAITNKHLSQFSRIMKLSERHGCRLTSLFAMVDVYCSIKI